MKDYYQVLGVSQTASEEEIKRAFKTLAKKHHPDANANDRKNSEEKFKEISEAYETIGSSDKRREYDQQREIPSFSGGFRGSPREGFQGRNEYSFGGIDDILKQFSGGGFSRGRGSGAGGRKGFSINGFEDLFAGGGSGAGNSATLKVPVRVACTGGHVNVSGLPGGTQRVQIPPKSRPGGIISLPTPEGPYHLELAVEDDPPFYVKGNNIETTITINLAQATLGSKVKLRDPYGDEMILTIPVGSQPSDKMRLKGLGFNGADLMVRLEVQIPKDLTEEQRTLLVQFAGKLGLKF